MDAWLWWLGAALLLGVIEMLTLDLIFAMLAGGAFFGMLSAVFGAPTWLQVIVFAVSSLLLLVLLRPWGLKKLLRKRPLIPTNVHAQIGKPAVVVADVSLRGGRVKLTGEVWTARTSDDVTLPTGTKVFVHGIDGATAIVSSESLSDAGVSEEGVAN